MNKVCWKCGGRLLQVVGMMETRNDFGEVSLHLNYECLDCYSRYSILIRCDSLQESFSILETERKLND